MKLTHLQSLTHLFYDTSQLKNKNIMHAALSMEVISRHGVQYNGT